ncbi:hypothetical protein [Candidatus Pseudoscillospira sp. SGI.172]|uniref:hypothetical protein n=1 Tax=Candidatus Pseudoscillospira sp. SGI.172 TaxID=3420582 RepID=UPI0009BA5FAB|nr:hypothetical protein [Pseudoflavonifractor sp.]MDY3018560.1 hypothetical protein [Oscillospiraceae bacterium]
MGAVAIRIGYAAMVAAIILAFLFSRRGEKELRFAVDRFAEAFLGLSNLVSPCPPTRRLAVRRVGGGVHPFPPEQQPEELRAILRVGAEEEAAGLYQRAEAAAVEVRRRSRRSRRLREQFGQPITDLCFLACVFIEGCQDLSTVDSVNRENAFTRFLTGQEEHRMALLKRISREFNDAFLELNQNYDLAALSEKEQAQSTGRAKTGRRGGEAI